MRIISCRVEDPRGYFINMFFVINRIRKAANVSKIEVVGHEPLLIQRTTEKQPKRSKRATYASWSSIDGKLDVISVHRQPSFVIYEHGTGYRVRCVFPDEYLGRVKDYLGFRVIVEGFVHYRGDGIPLMLSQPTAIQKLDAPKQEDISVYRGLLPSISGGLSSYEYVRQLRENNA